MNLPTIVRVRALGHHGPRASGARLGEAVLCLLVLALSGACTLLIACSPGTPAESGGLPPPATRSPGPLATAMPVETEDVWAQVRAVIPLEVLVYKPTFVPDRLGSPERLEARVDDEHGTRYTVTNKAGDEQLVFILGL